MDERTEKQERYKDRWSGYRWEWSGVLFLPPSCSRNRAVRYLEHWLKDLEEAEGGKHFRWVTVIKRNTRYMGRRIEDDHIHLLVGSLRNRRRDWEERWRKLTGANSHIHHFDKEDEMETFGDMLQSMDDDGELDMKCKLVGRKRASNLFFR